MAPDEAMPAKDRFTSLDTLALVREIRSVGRLFVDKIFDVEPDTWEVTLRGPGTGKWALRLAPGRYAALRREAGGHAEGLGHLSRELRRHLGGNALTAVIEPRGERFLELETRRGDSGTLRLIVEFFGHGNILLVRDDRILAVAHPRTWAHRTVKPGATYAPPPAHANPWEMSAAELEAALNRSRGDRVRTLAAQLGFGGLVAEEVLRRAEVAPNTPAPQDAARVATQLRSAIADLVTEVGDVPRGFLYRRDDLLVDVEPFSSRRWADDPSVRVEKMERFSDAVMEYFSSLGSSAPAAKPDPLAEIRRQAGRQETAILELRAEVDRLRLQAEAIFEHYEEAERELASRGSVKPGETVEVELGTVTVPLVGGQTPRESAQAIYAELKRVQSKVEGAEAALRTTRLRLDQGALVPEPARPEGRGPAPRRPQVRWFERFRWFLTSEGLLVVGGRDAATNDLIVRRYLGPRDRYVHADVHGAASVVLKQPPNRVSEPEPSSMSQAGQWAVSFSKAWRAGHASADAFWVTPEQVSKSGGSGEFVARGAWVIHGTKHWIKDCPLELGLGEVDYEGESRWVAAPPEALRAQGRLRLVLVPGDERDRSKREVEIAGELGISRDLLQRLLPAGGLSIRRQ